MSYWIVYVKPYTSNSGKGWNVGDIREMQEAERNPAFDDIVKRFIDETSAKRWVEGFPYGITTETKVGLEEVLSYSEASTAHSFNPLRLYNLYSQSKKKILSDVTFDVIKQEYDKYY